MQFQCVPMEFNSRVNQLIVTINQSTIVSDNDGKAVYLSSIVSFHESNLGFVCLFALRARILYYGSVAAAAFLLSQVSDVAATILLKPGSYLVYESILVWPILSTILWLHQSRQDTPPPPPNTRSLTHMQTNSISKLTVHNTSLEWLHAFTDWPTDVIPVLFCIKQHGQKERKKNEPHKLKWLHILMQETVSWLNNDIKQFWNWSTTSDSIHHLLTCTTGCGTPLRQYGWDHENHFLTEIYLN